MRIIFHNLNADDLRVVTIADLLINIEADLEIWDGEDVVYSEKYFPVAELARELERWRNSPELPLKDFEFSSLSFADPGAVRFFRDGNGWAVSSTFANDRKSRSISWPDLITELESFARRVAEGTRMLGFDPQFIGT
jgi:hypothetical protein